MEMLKGI